jgi:hypothetical protein
MNARANIILILLFSTMFVLWLINQTLQLDIYYMGIDMYHTQIEIEQVQKENMILNEEALSQRSYTIIYKEATDMGFTTAHEVVIK